jgi:hypothetical protein
MNQEAGKPARSIAARLLQKAEEKEANYREQCWALGSLYLAGSDTPEKFSSQILMYAQPLIHIPWPYLDADALPSTAWHSHGLPTVLLGCYLPRKHRNVLF